MSRVIINNLTQVITGRRRFWSDEQKRTILSEADSTSASAVCRKYGLTYTGLGRWRKALNTEAEPSALPGASAQTSDALEIRVGRLVIKVGGDLSSAALSDVLGALVRAA